MSLKTMWMRRFDLMDTSVSQEKKVLYNSLMYKNNSLFFSTDKSHCEGEKKSNPYFGLFIH